MKNNKITILALCLSLLSLCTTNVLAKALVQKESLRLEIIDITNSVLKMPLNKGVSVDDARISINTKAKELNIKKMGYFPFSDELKGRGLKPRHLEIFQFCNPEDAIKMVEFNSLYAAFMPCYISLVEDKKGRLWLQMINLDMIIDKYPLPEGLRKIAITINAQMLAIITAGVKGRF